MGTLGNVTATNPQKRVLILAWTKFFGSPFRDKIYLSACPKLFCHITNERKDILKADAVVFHVRDTNVGDLPAVRSFKQRFVFLSHEAPPHAGLNWNEKRLRNFFNWTMTYRHDSDIFYPYSYMAKYPLTPSQEKEEQGQISRFLNSKSQSIVWFVSNCHTPSKRELIVKKLKNYVQVDIFGGCGRRGVCSNKADRKCVNDLINHKYYFHLVLENSVCRDYVTEKFWIRWNLYSVPIVFNRKQYQPIAPPNSFIAIDDFPSIQKLAEYLKNVQKTPKIYRSYFEWRTLNSTTYRRSATEENGRHFGFCRLCQRLLDTTETEGKKWYETLKTWWVDESYCQEGHKLALKYVQQ